MNFINLKTVGSTNDYALSLIGEAAKTRSIQSLNKTVVIAEEQTAGKGRMKRNFYSPSKNGLYLSAIYAPHEPLASPAVLTAFAAVAVCRALEKIFSIEAKIKWVNDIYVREKKVCGILAEGHINWQTQKIDAAVVGIGINIFAQDFPSEIESKAGSVLQEQAQDEFADKEKTRANLAEEICGTLFALYENASTDNALADSAATILEEYKSRSFLIGKKVKVIPTVTQQEKSFIAEVIDIDKDARLVVRTEQTEELLLDSGEVSLEAQADPTKLEI